MIQIEVAITCALTFTLMIIGMIFYQFVWLDNYWSRTPVLNSSSPDQFKYLPTSEDKPHTNLFTLYIDCFKIIYLQPALPFINKFGIEQYFYFALRTRLMVSQLFSLFLVQWLIATYGMFNFKTGQEIFERIFGGSADNELNTATFNCIVLSVITFPMVYQIYIVVNFYNEQLDLLYEKSEISHQKQQKGNQFWYFFRTSFVKCIDVDDINAKKFKYVCKKLLSKQHNQNSLGKIENCQALPDFVDLIDLQRQEDWVKDRYNDNLFTGSCSKLFKCLSPIYYYDIGSYQSKQNEITEKIDKHLENEIKSSSFGFVQTNNLKSSRILKFETSNYYTDSNSLKIPLLQDSMLALDNQAIQTEMVNLNYDTEKIHENMNSDSDDTPKELKNQNGIDNECFENNTISFAEKLPPAEHHNIAMTLLRKLFKKDSDENRYIGEHKDKNPFDPQDILWLNLGVTVKEGFVKRFGFMIIVCLMFFFLSTPSAILQAMKQTVILKEILSLEWAEKLPHWLESLVRNYFLTGITLLCNKQFLIIANWIAQSKRFATKYEYHRYLLKICYIYLVINMVIAPGIALSGISSLYELVMSNRETDWQIFINSFSLIDDGSFFLNLVIQSIGIGFLVECSRWQDLYLGAGSSYIAKKVRKCYNDHNWLQEEGYQLPLGTKSAYLCTYIFMIGAFGWQCPMIIQPITAWVFFNNVSDSKLMICYHKKETENFGRLFGLVLRRIAFGILISHFVKQCTAAISIEKFAFCQNFMATFAHIVLFLMINNLFQYTYHIQERLGQQYSRKMTKDENQEWLEMYSHPLIVEKERYVNVLEGNPLFAEYLQRFVYPINTKNKLHLQSKYLARDVSSDGSDEEKKEDDTKNIDNGFF